MPTTMLTARSTRPTITRILTIFFATEKSSRTSSKAVTVIRIVVASAYFAANAGSAPS